MTKTLTMTTAQLATALHTTPRELRKFLRADAKANSTETPGKGRRYALPANATAIKSFTKKFAAWEDAQKVRTTANDEVQDDSDIEVDEDNEVDSLDDAEPTDEDIEDITAEL